MTFIDELQNQRQAAVAAAQAILSTASAQNRRSLTAQESRAFDACRADIDRVSGRIDELTDDAERRSAIESNPMLQKLRGGGGGEVSSAGRLAPLGYGDEQMRRAFDQLSRGETAVMETRTTNVVGGLIPPELGPILPVMPRHDLRVMNFLPGIGIDVPSISYLEVDATVGSAGIVAEGGPKPELVMPAIQKIATARKLAAHTGISWEAYSGDYGAFSNAIQVELMKKVVDVENGQLYGGTGEANGQVNGIATNANVLTLDASTITTQPGPWDAIEKGIELLRSGPDLAEADLVLCHPATFSAIRRTTDLYGRYYSAPDPSSDETTTVWGLRVVVSTQFTAGQLVLLDSQQYGRVVVRESLVTRIGYSGTDFTDNVVRLLSEERITQTIERPKSICLISKLPVAATATTKTEATAKK